MKDFKPQLRDRYRKTRKYYCKEWQDPATFFEWYEEKFGNEKVYLRAKDGSKPIGPDNYEVSEYQSHLNLPAYLCGKTTREWSDILRISRTRIYQLLKKHKTMEAVLKHRNR